MKVVILAGGLGTRISEESGIKPKPMIEIGNKPILWHIMKIYSHYGFNDFVILAGYKGHLIKEYFASYFFNNCDVTFNINTNQTTIHKNNAEPWNVTVVDTGLETLTGGRIKKAEGYLKNAPFLLTYGDGVSDVNINDLISFHKRNKKIMTMTAIQPEGRFGRLNLDGHNVSSFEEKPIGDGAWINGGFFICEPTIFNYIDNSDQVIFEKGPINKLANDSQICAFKHTGFWKSMDTLKDKHDLEQLWKSQQIPWKVWN
jgi:glucose-1-phosphate cytidylyltransferase